jgi:GDPmannose 4,6-dehydratase
MGARWRGGGCPIFFNSGCLVFGVPLFETALLYLGRTNILSNMKKALIYGVSGQDGRYLSELLLEQGYSVVGVVRRQSVAENQTTRVEHLLSNPNFSLVYGDITDPLRVYDTIKQVKPNEIYNLAAQSQVQNSFNMPRYTGEVAGLGVLNILNAILSEGIDCKMYQASTSEMFGNTIDEDSYQRETTPFYPVSPYGSAKLFAHNLCQNYRDSYGIEVFCGILFNHESPYRGSTFVTGKVVKDAVLVANGKKEKVVLGNLNSARDFGHAKDYVRAMQMMLQLEKPDDFVVSTGISHTIDYLVDYVFEKLNLDRAKRLEISNKYLRPNELHLLRGDSAKFRTKTGWKPEISFEAMLDEMIEYQKKQISDL